MKIRMKIFPGLFINRHGNTFLIAYRVLILLGCFMIPIDRAQAYLVG
ncbi:MAG: hypothetical protein ACMUHX_10850 [bacterium]